jgi:threonine dehydrogenase-like Zn-dependent dehydrogenase
LQAAIFRGPGSVDVGERPDPVIQQPTDAIVRVVLGCVCGSDLWYFRGESPHAAGSIGHEFIGVVEQAGAEVRRPAAPWCPSRAQATPTRCSGHSWPCPT